MLLLTEGREGPRPRPAGQPTAQQRRRAHTAVARQPCPHGGQHRARRPAAEQLYRQRRRCSTRVGRAKGRARLQGGSGVGAGFHTAVVDGQPQGKLPRPEREEEGAGHG